MKKILCVLLLLLTATLTFAETTKENACNFSRPGDGFERIARRCNIDLKDLEKIIAANKTQSWWKDRNFIPKNVEINLGALGKKEAIVKTKKVMQPSKELAQTTIWDKTTLFPKTSTATKPANQALLQPKKKVGPVEKVKEKPPAALSAKSDSKNEAVQQLGTVINYGLPGGLAALFLVFAVGYAFYDRLQKKEEVDDVQIPQEDKALHVPPTVNDEVVTILSNSSLQKENKDSDKPIEKPKVLFKPRVYKDLKVKITLMGRVKIFATKILSPIHDWWEETQPIFWRRHKLLKVMRKKQRRLKLYEYGIADWWYDFSLQRMKTLYTRDRKHTLRQQIRELRKAAEDLKAREVEPIVLS